VAGLPNLVAAVVVMAGFVLLSRATARGVSRLMDRASQTEVIVRLMASLSRAAVLGAGFVIALGVLGLQKTVLSLLAGVGVIGLALGFAFQDMAANLMAGIALGIRRPFDIGDVIRTGDIDGAVKEIALRTTTIQTFTGQLVLIPNRQVFERPLMNFTRLGVRRVDVEVGVAYDSDLEEVATVARHAIEQLPFLAPDRPVDVLAKGFGGSSIDFVVRYWIPDTGDVSFPVAGHRGILALKRAFDAAGIEIPFPIRTLDLAPAARAALRAAPERVSLSGREAG
jgi:small conductance mechanosensitive channel